MAALIETRPGLTVVELGAGTGATSAEIGSRLGPGAQHIAVEREAELLARAAPWVCQVLGDARRLRGSMAELGMHAAATLSWSPANDVTGPRRTA